MATTDAPGSPAESPAPPPGAAPQRQRPATDRPGRSASSVDPETQRLFWGEDVDSDRDVSRPADGGGGPRGRRARQVERVLRGLSPWSVLKVSALFYACLWIVLLIAGALLWRAGEMAGLIDNAENFVAKATGNESVEWDGRLLLRTAAGAGAILVVAATAVTVLMTVLFNLISELTGGIRATVLELERAPRPTRRDRSRRSPRSA